MCLVGKLAERTAAAGTCGDRSYMGEKLRILSVCGEIITIERYKKWCEGEVVKLPTRFNDNNWGPVSDPCQSCEMAPVITSQCRQIAELQKERDGWRDATQAHCRQVQNCLEQLAETRADRYQREATARRAYRNAAYWREELFKLRKEPLAESDDAQKLTECYEILKHIPERTQHGTWCPDHMIDWIEARKQEEWGRIAERDGVPLAGVATIHIIPRPEKLLLSDDARRVIEILKARGPSTIRDIVEFADFMPGSDVVDGLIAAQEAGRVSLSGGKYSIVKEE